MRLEITLSCRGVRLKEGLELEAGRGIAVLGASRDDNTTLLRAIAGFEKAQLLIDGHRAKLPPRRHFVLCAAEPQLFPHLTVEENLRLCAAEHSEGAWNNITRVLELDGVLDSLPHQLSPLQAHCAVLARALLNQPRLLLIDEPQLEERDHARYIDRLITLLPGLSFPVISACSRVDDAARLGDHWLYLVGGEARALASANELLLRDDLPLLDEEQATFRLPVVVAGHNTQQRRSHLDFRGGRLSIPLCRCKVGSKMFAGVPLAGAYFSSQPPSPDSGLSGITVTITSLHPRSDDRQLLELDADGTTLWLLLPRKAVEHQGLAPGKQGFAIYPAAMLAAD